MFLYFKRREKRGKMEAPRPRFLVLRRKTLTVGAALLAAAAIFGAVNAPAAVRASVATRQLPIYCVERDQKVCSISFDAAWGLMVQIASVLCTVLPVQGRQDAQDAVGLLFFCLAFFSGCSFLHTVSSQDDQFNSRTHALAL